MGKKDPKNLDLYKKLIETLPGIERKGATTAYTSLNGNMFTYLSKEGEMGIRLPDDAKEAFLKRFDTTLLEQYGSVMKEYVKVPQDMMKDTKSLGEFLTLSLEYVQTLKPKK
jgi:hypothetical protein